MADAADTFNDVLRAIRKITQAMEVHSKHLERTIGVTGPQLLLLKEIQLNDSIITSKLAENICMSQSTATTILDKLVEKELVVRSRNNFDKREWHLGLSPKGHGLVAKLPPFLPQKFIMVFSTLPTWRQTQILATLQHVVNMLVD